MTRKGAPRETPLSNKRTTPGCSKRATSSASRSNRRNAAGGDAVQAGDYRDLQGGLQRCHLLQVAVQLAGKIEEVAGVDTVAPVLLGRITNLKGVNKLVTIFGVDSESYDRIGNGIRIIEGHGLQEPHDLVVCEGERD